MIGSFTNQIQTKEMKKPQMPCDFIKQRGKKRRREKEKIQRKRFGKGFSPFRFSFFLMTSDGILGFVTILWMH